MKNKLPNELTIKSGNFLKKRKKFFMWEYGKEKIVDMEELEKASPLLLYIDENMNAKIYEGVGTGKIKPYNSKGEVKEYSHEIHTSKKIMLNYNGAELPIYILFEGEKYCYPHEPKVDALRLFKNYRNLIANYRQFEESQKEGWWDFNLDTVKTWLWMLGGLIGIIFAALWLWKTFSLGAIFASNNPAPVVIDVINQTINNTVNSGTVVVK